MDALALQVPAPRSRKPLNFCGVCGSRWRANDAIHCLVHPGRAEGHFFNVIQSFQIGRSAETDRGDVGVGRVEVGSKTSRGPEVAR